MPNPKKPNSYQCQKRKRGCSLAAGTIKDAMRISLVSENGGYSTSSPVVAQFVPENVRNPHALVSGPMVGAPICQTPFSAYQRSSPRPSSKLSDQTTISSAP